MKIIIKTEKIELTPAIKEFIEEKIGGLEKFVTLLQEEEKDYFEGRKPKIEALVEVGKTTLHHKKGPFFRAECQIVHLKKSIRATAKSEDLRQAIVEVKDELQIQLKKYKEKPKAKARKSISK
ncbi:ribosome-associated translation inhibitor RaiA [Candidatus Parcubacteria bacterium]|nr:ribosome-associated translation inhibitor RaiA [Candidatus Parcubacteria bacterium]